MTAAAEYYGWIIMTKIIAFQSISKGVQNIVHVELLLFLAWILPGTDSSGTPTKYTVS